jgi:carbonic anhydrase
MTSIKSLVTILSGSLIILSCGQGNSKTENISTENSKTAKDTASVAKETTVHAVGVTAENSAAEILESLKAGNARFVNELSAGENSHSSYNFSEQLAHTKTEQHPIAFVLTCIDSRVSPEILFDEGIGALFVGRVAGNVEDKDLLGSMEYAVAVKHVKLIVVLGHTNCGAISAAFGTLDPADEELVQLVRHVKQNVVPNDAPPYDASAIHNVKVTIDEILKNSKLLHAKAESMDVKIVGGLYNVANGKVTWDLQ